MRKLTDLVEHRVEANLEAIRATLLVDLPADRRVHGLTSLSGSRAAGGARGAHGQRALMCCLAAQKFGD